MLNKDMKIIDGNVILPGKYGGESYSLPVEALKAIATHRYDVLDALTLLDIHERAENYEWVKASDLVSKSLLGKEVWFFVSNWEDSCWEVETEATHARAEKNGEVVLRKDPYKVKEDALTSLNASEYADYTDEEWEDEATVFDSYMNPDSDVLVVTPRAVS